MKTVVKPGEQATFDYAFKPHENLGGRPFGIVVALYYKDSDGKDWMDSVFNETVTFKEHDEGFDGETFFLYVFVAAMAILVIMGAQYILSSLGVCVYVLLIMLNISYFHVIIIQLGPVV